MKIQRVLTIWSAYPSTAKGKRKINGVVSLGPRIPQKNIKNKICRPVNSNFRASHEILVHTMFAPNVSYRPRPVPTKYSRTIKQMSSYGCFRVSRVLFRQNRNSAGNWLVVETILICCLNSCELLWVLKCSQVYLNFEYLVLRIPVCTMVH